MKKFVLALLLCAPMFGFAQQGKIYNLLIGSYTNSIPVYRFNSETGTVTLHSSIETENPVFLAVSADKKFVYANNSQPKNSDVSAFRFDAKAGKLEFINKQSAAGANPVHIALAKDGKNLFISNYTSGNLTVMPVNKDGSIGAVSQNLQYYGTGGSVKQTSPHVHATALSDDGKYIFVADLGTDKVNVYNYDGSKPQPLSPADPAYYLSSPGDGPRHFEFSPDKKFLYVIQELTGYVRAYKYEDGKLTFIQTINMMPVDFDQNQAADIHVSPDGNFLYASNRKGADNIALYARDQKSGKLTFIETTKVSKAPRGFAIDPTGNYLLCAGQLANVVDFFKIDKATGKLTPTDTKIEIKEAVCLTFVPVE